MALPKAVVRDDRRLEQATTAASELLAELRWHWTLDETNPDRIGLREYAREVDRHLKTIQKYANGYALFRDGDISVTEAIERASMGAEREAATQAVAKVRDLSFSTVRQSRPSEVRRVLDVARESVEQHGGTIEEEAEKAATWIVKAEQADREHAAARRERLGMRFIGLEERLQRVKRELTQAVNEAAAVEWGEEEQEMLAQTLAQVRGLLELLDLAIVGAVDVDWDGELAGLGGEMITVARAGLLFDFAAEQPEGFLAKEAMAALELTRSQFTKTARALRLILANDSINLICLQEGFGEPKRYHLVGTLEKAGPWVRERMRGIESQLESVLAISTSLVNASDGRTVDGKKARLVARHVGRLVEDLGELDGQFPRMR